MAGLKGASQTRAVAALVVVVKSPIQTETGRYQDPTETLHIGETAVWKENVFSGALLFTFTYSQLNLLFLKFGQIQQWLFTIFFGYLNI